VYNDDVGTVNQWQHHQHQHQQPVTSSPAKKPQPVVSQSIDLVIFLFGEIAPAQAIATHFYVAWSVCLSHLCTLLKPSN